VITLARLATFVVNRLAIQELSASPGLFCPQTEARSESPVSQPIFYCRPSKTSCLPALFVILYPQNVITDQ
jgi:hypothetical protein